MYEKMNLKDMNYILEQAGSMAEAMTNILEALCAVIPDEGRAVYVDCSNEINFISKEDAQTFIDCLGERCEVEAIGNSDFHIVYDPDSKVTIDGDSYLLGEYLILKFEEYGLVPLKLDDMDELESVFGSRLVPFVIGEDKTEVYQF